MKSVFKQTQDVFMKAPWHWAFIALLQFLILLCAIPLIAVFQGAMRAVFLDSMPWFITYVLPFIVNVLYLMIVWSMMLNLYRMGQAALAGTEPQVKDIFRHDTRLTPFVLTVFAVAVIVYFGTLVFVIPGLVASVVFFFADVSSVEEHTGVKDSLYRSYELVRKDWWAVILFMLLSAVLSLIALIPLGLGLLLYVPFIAIAKIVFFREMRALEPMVVEKR